MMDPLRLAAKVATDGGNVAVIASRIENATRIAQGIFRQSRSDEVRSYSNRAERIDYMSDGRVLILTHNVAHRLRGYRLDLVVMDDWQMIRDADLMLAVLPCFATGETRIAVLAEGGWFDGHAGTQRERASQA